MNMMNDSAMAEECIVHVDVREPIVTTELPESLPMTRVLYLERDNVLRIIDGAGVRVVAATGVVWLTEEHVSADIVLGAGASHVIGSLGKTVLLAHRPAWVLVQLPAGTTTSRIELASRDGRPGTPVVVRAHAAMLVARWCARMLGRLAGMVFTPTVRRATVPYY